MEVRIHGVDYAFEHQVDDDWILTTSSWSEKNVQDYPGALDSVRGDLQNLVNRCILINLTNLVRRAQNATLNDNVR